MNRQFCILFIMVSFLTGYSTVSLAAVSDTVTDTQGNPINHALVTFTSESDSSIIYRAVTDSLGHYVLPDNPVGIREESPLPFALNQNYPNPFNPSTTISFTLDAPGHVTLTLYNIMGQRTRTIIDDYLSSGQHGVVWDGRDESGKGVASGVYLFRLSLNGRSQTKKMLLLDGGGVSGGGYARQTQKAAKQASGENALYTITVDRFPYASIRQEHRDITETTLDFTLQESEEMVTIPGGTFQMGDVEDAGYANEKPVHSVTLTQFEMSNYEVTNAQYCAYLNAILTANDIMATSSSVTGTSGLWSGQEYIYLAGYNTHLQDNDCKIVYNGSTFSVKNGCENWPVTWVTWYGSKAFVMYYGFDLPTESEWEYACRSGQQLKYGTDNGTLSNTKANYYLNGPGHPVNVGSYPPNPFGLYDMSGNVWEWCNDWHEAYTSDSAANPTGAPTGSSRLSRGGSWTTVDGYCRSAVRGYMPPAIRLDYVGFRVVHRPGGVVY